ncbi:MAG: PHP domain-containing protein [Candidatus Eisenbacteria bacterium]
MPAPLRIQTRYSARRSIVEPADLAAALRRAGYDGGAIVDRGVLFGFAEARASFEDEGIALVAGAEVVVRFSRPGGGLPPPAYVLTVFPESTEGMKALSRLLEKIWRDDRPERIRGAAEWDEFADAANGWIVGSGGLAGPVSGAFARGRVGDARRLARLLAGRFGAKRFFLETTRAGSERERLVEPFLGEIAERHGLRRLAADPVRYLEAGERRLWERVMRTVPPSTSEDPTDPFADEIAAHLPSREEWERRYEDAPDALAATSEIVERCRGAAWEESPPAGGRETDELIRLCIERLAKRYGGRFHSRRKEIESRFWDEFWRIEGAGLHRFAIRLSRLFRSLRNAEPDVEIMTTFLSGSLLGYLLDLQDTDPIDRGYLMAPLSSAGSRVLQVEADRRTATRLRKLVEERHPGETATLLIPDTPDPSEFEKAEERPLPGEDTGPKPHPPTASPSGVTHRGNRGPVPLPGVRERRVFERVIAGYRRDRRTLLWAEDPVRLWDFALSTGPAGSAAVLLRVSDSSLLGVLRETRNLARGSEEGGRPWELIRRGALAGLAPSGMPPFRDLLRILPPESVNDLAVLLATGAKRRTRMDLFERIAAVRSGDRPAPLTIPESGAFLAETGGIPFFREQLAAVVRHFAGYDAGRTERLFDAVSGEDGASLARERALFLRKAADRGADGTVVSRFFSLLLALAPDAPCRGDFEPVAGRIVEGARRKGADPVGFAAAALSARIIDAKDPRGLAAGLRREGVTFLPLHMNRSCYRFRREGDRVRAGLGIVRGMTAEWAARFEEEREIRGEFRSTADLLERLAARRFPRPLVLELARVFRGREERMTMEREDEKRSIAKEEAGDYSPEAVRADRRDPAPRKKRSRRASAQTAFSFLDSVDRKGPGRGRRSMSRGEAR